MGDINQSGDKSIVVVTNLGTINNNIQYGNETIKRLLGDSLTFIHKEEFVGRIKDLEALHQIFFDEKKEIILLSADAGIGKTGLASQYYRENESNYSHLIWLVSEPTINQKIQTLEKSLNITSNDDFTEEQKLYSIYNKLRNLDKPTLLVVDDSDDYQDLINTCSSLSSLNIHTLITTRINELKPYFVYGLGRLENEEIIELFKNYYGLFDENETHILEQIITIADKNTLLIEIFAKNLESKNTEHEIRFSLNELKNTIENGLHHIVINEEIQVNHNRTKKERSKQDKKAMSVLLALYDTEKLEEVEKKILYTFTLLPKGEIHYQTLKAITQEEQIDNQLKSLTRKGWIKKNTENKTYSIKTLVKESISYRYKEGIQDIADPLLERISELIDDDEKSKEEIQQIIEIYLPLGKAVLENVMSISPNLSETAFDLLNDLHYFERNLLNITSDYSISYEQLKKHIKQQEAKSGGNSSTALLEFYHVFVRVCEKENKLLEAIEYQDLIIGIYREYYKQDKNGLINVLNKGAGLCYKYNRNQLQKALEYRQEEYELLKQVNSLETRIATWQNNISGILIELGGKEYLEKAKKYLEKSLVTNSKYMQENILKLAVIQTNLANALVNLGGIKNLEKAKEYLENTIDIDIKYFGENSLKGVINQSNLAVVLRDLGGVENLQKAKKYLEKALDVNNQHFAEINPKIAFLQTHLARTLADLGGIENLQRAKEYLEKALHTEIQNFGENIPSEHHVLNYLANVLIELGGIENLQRAEEYLENDITRNIQYFGENSPNIVMSQSNLVRILTNLGGIENLEKAKKYAEKALSISTKHLGENNPNVIIVQMNLSIVLKNLGGIENLQRAKEYAEKALNINISNFGENNLKVVMFQSNLAAILKDLGGIENLEKAKKYLEKALNIYTQNFEENHPNVAIIQCNLAGVLHDIGGKTNLEEAKKHFERSLVITIKHFGENSLNVAILNFNLGGVFQNLGKGENLPRVKELYKAAFITVQKYFPQGHTDLGIISDSLIGLYFLMEQNEKITELSQELWNDMQPQFWQWFHREE